MATLPVTVNSKQFSFLDEKNISFLLHSFFVIDTGLCIQSNVCLTNLMYFLNLSKQERLVFVILPPSHTPNTPTPPLPPPPSHTSNTNTLTTPLRKACITLLNAHCQQNFHLSGPVQTSNFSCAESNVNELEQRILLISISIGTWKVRRLNY